ncbi:unnamed protein product [Spodoptera littoralis]|uniref:Uncharacterized protein n=1 Tax=Spodoptera littoralis TaxID=7109 RepID=A0A9P0I171_SPOLI|nr:unnamed protein product [Spodoptera littoralis]CAH1637556.1 unnamed protein product [Spodoptera littoralis]
MTHCHISETKIDERFIRMLHKASTTQSTQVTGPLIVMETARAAQSNIKTPSPKGISLVFNQEENKRRKDLEDTMNIIKNSMFQKKFDALSLNTNASVEHIDTIPLIRSTRTVNDAISLKISETARTAAQKETHDTKSNSNVTGKILIKRHEQHAPKEPNENDCFKTGLGNTQPNEHGHVAARPTTSVNRSDSNIRDLFYMGDDSRIVDTGTNRTIAKNGKPVETVSARVHRERERNEVETTLSRTRHSFNGNQSTSQNKEPEHKISRKSFPNIFKKHSNVKNVEDSGFTKIVHNIVSKISTLSKHSNVGARDNTLDVKAKKITLDRETSNNTQVNRGVDSDSIENKRMQLEHRNFPRRLSSTGRPERCLTEIISMKQNKSDLFVTKASSNVHSDHFKTESKTESIRKCESVIKYNNIVTDIEPAIIIAKETSVSQKDRSLTTVASMKLKDLKDKPKIELLNTRETAQIGQNTHLLQSGSHIDEDTITKAKTIQDQSEHNLVIEEISDTQSDPNITTPERNRQSNPNKSSIEERSKGQTNLMIPETAKNNEIGHKPGRETSSPGIEGVSKVQAETAKQSGIDGITPQKLQIIDKNIILNIPSKSSADNANLIKSCFESKFETVMSRLPAVQNTSSQSDRYETENVVNKQSSNVQSVRKVMEAKVFISNESKRSLSKDSSQNRNCADETTNPSNSPKINESNRIKIEQNTTETIIKEGETSHKENTDENVTNGENIKISESMHTSAQTDSVLIIDDNEEQVPIISSENIYSHSHSDRNVIQFRLDNMNKLLYTPQSKKDDDLSGTSDKMCEAELNGSKYTFGSYSDYKRISDYKNAFCTKCPFCPQSEMGFSKIELPCAVSDSNESEFMSIDTDQTVQTTSASFDVSTSAFDDENQNVCDKIIMARELSEPSNASKTEGGPSQVTAASGNDTTIKDRIRALLFPPFINEDIIILKPSQKKK